MLKTVKPKTARSKRILEKKQPQLVENPKTTLFLRGQNASQVVQLALADLNALKRPLSIRFTKKNDGIHPFEDPSSLEFFSEKNDAALLVFGYHSKKRPHCLTFIRCFSHKVLDMLELYIDPESFRTLNQFKNEKCAVGAKPLLSFSGTPFESPTTNAYSVAKSLFVDLFRGHDAPSIDIEGLQYMIHISAEEEVEGQPAPKIRMRVYKLVTKRSGEKTPLVELEEMGPRIDFHVGRHKQADESIMKEALKRPRALEARTKKNIETDIVGDKVGRIHVGKQDLTHLQTRKMKGLKRDRGESTVDATDLKERSASPPPKKSRAET
ncbi:Brix-domain-containing protein [Eremomyces bilateralis CBS 781.70]|uniref:Ribosome production factor 2 homolog n=1 Tax=Eremomyces bilateralis CBS 781.70 TaxID=1392243 RepID=A0A6G1G6L3_9PEZI|nr:Brix-domain-containing protein [Eremomyces bilateralis CBS 781.70]KAF1813662.1 Brix-domain-containing protein [Eremomyces bilateralis CBS 781.70]